MSNHLVKFKLNAQSLLNHYRADITKSMYLCPSVVVTGAYNSRTKNHTKLKSSVATTCSACH